MNWMHAVSASPLYLTVGLVLAVSVIVPCLAVWLVRKKWPYPAFKENNEFVGFTYSVFGLIYGVLMAFTIVVAWERFSATERTVLHEATVLSELWRDCQAFPPAIHDRIHADLIAYARSVIEDEWPEMAKRGTAHRGTQALYEKLWAHSYRLQPETKNQEIFLAEYMGRLNDLSGTRRLRIMYSRAEVHYILWLVLLVCAVPTLAYPLLFATKHGRVQVALTSCIMAIVLMGLLVILQLQYPYTGSVNIRPEAYEDLLQGFHNRLFDKPPPPASETLSPHT